MGKLRSNEVERVLARTLDEFTARPGARVLDIGAGQVVEKNRRAGFHSLAERYARLISGGGYIGLEIGIDAHPAIPGDAHRLPFCQGAMDGVLMVSVLEHLYDPIRAVDEVLRVLKPGGIFFSYAPFYHPFHASPHDYFRFTAEGYRYLLRGFSEKRVISGGNYLAVLNDVVSLPLARAGRAGRLLAKLIELPVGFAFRRMDGRLGSDVAVGFGAWARK
ncbi:MAG: class I SAM-dependent methyltransferase [Rudaea sp.]